MKHLKIYELFNKKYSKFYIVKFNNKECLTYIEGKKVKIKHSIGGIEGGWDEILLLEVIEVINKRKSNEPNKNIITAFRALEYLYDKDSPNNIKFTGMAVNVYYDIKNNIFMREGGYDPDTKSYANPGYKYEILWEGDDKEDAYNMYSIIYHDSPKYNL